MDRRSRVPMIVGILFLVVPLLVAAGGLIVWRGADPVPQGDAALIELCVRAAMHGEQAVGSYSRLGFVHPGPLLFYLLVPFYWLAGEDCIGLHLGAIAINVTALIGISAVLARCTEGAVRLFGFLLFGLFCVFSDEILLSFWDPVVVILPFLFVTMACAASMAGESRYLGLAAVAATLVAQAYLSYAPTLVLLCAACILHRWRQGWNWAGRTWWWILVVAVLWVPVVLDEFFLGGNVSDIFNVFTGVDGPSRPLAETYAVCAAATSRFFGFFFGQEIDLTGMRTAPGWVQVVYWLQIVAIVACTVVGRRCAEPFLAAVGKIALVCHLACWLSIHALRGDVIHHILHWMSAVGLFALLAVGLVIARLCRVPGRMTRTVGVSVNVTLVVACAAVLYWMIMHMTFGSARITIDYRKEPAGQLIRTMYREAEHTLKRDSPILLRVTPNEFWHSAPPLAVLLARRGFRPWAVGDHGNRFPRAFRWLGDPDDVSATHWMLVRAPASLTGDWKLLVEVSGQRLYSR